MPWLSTVKLTAHRNGGQSWYSVMNGMTMKKWKCASMLPPERCTITEEHHTRPAVTKNAANLRFRT
jgi:hypothetical protein